MSHWRGAAVVSVSAFTVDVLSIEEAEEVRSAVEWAEVRAMHVDGVTKREIARRLGISRNTVERLLSASVAKKSPRSRFRGLLGRGDLMPPRALATRERARARHADRRPRLVRGERLLMAGERACSRHEAHVNKAPTCVVVIAAVEVAATGTDACVGGQSGGRVR